MRNSCFFSLLTVVLSSYFFHTSGYAQIGFDIPSGKNKVSFPFESYNNLIVVPVILNHQIPLRFVLDTGVRTSILTDRTFSDILNIQMNHLYLKYIPDVSLDGPGIVKNTGIGKGHYIGRNAQWQYQQQFQYLQGPGNCLFPG